ncbi:MAG TPA: hypothetical protein VEI97_06245, partial [bacterium]|nr:hypothetical protein [bacterium]
MDEGTVPPASSIGVTFGAEDLRVIVMGAEGDPLSPLIQTLPYRQLTAGRPGSPLSLDQWRTVLLRDAVHLRLQASYLSFMAVPDSLESGCALFGWRAGPGFRFAVGRAAPVKQQAVEVEADPVSGVARYRLPAGPGTEPYYAWIGRASGTAVRSGAFGGWLWQTQELPRDARSPLLLGYEPPDTTPSRYVPLGRAEALPHLAPVHAPVGTWKPVTTPPQKADDLVPGGDIRPFLIKEQFTALVAERRRVNPQAPLLEPYDLAHWLLEVPEDGAGRPLPVRRRPTFDALKETHPPGLYFGQYHQDLLELSIQTTPGPVQPRGISSGGMPRTPIAPPPPGPKVDPRGVLNQL